MSSNHEVNLTTNYLGLKLRSPLVASAGPLCKDIDHIRRMEDAGVSAIVLHSLFEEQIEMESEDLDRSLEAGSQSYAESLTYLPEMGAYNMGPDAYLNHLRKAKEAVTVPVIASLNGNSMGGWIRYARMMEDAGADGLELNVYDLPTDPDFTGAQIEADCINLVKHVVKSVHIPVAVKIGPFFSSIPNMVRRFSDAGAKGVVLFNRFYQPDFDLQTLEVVPDLLLSNSSELLLRLHWTAICYGKVHCDLAITGGVHSAFDVLKSMMAGARVAMMTSVMLRRGIGFVTEIERELKAWMQENEYDSIQQMQGSMSYQSVPNTSAFERGNYMRVLSSYALKSRVM